jgi:ribose transport system permease protein
MVLRMTDDPTAPASRAGADRALAPAAALQRLVSLILSRYATLLILVVLIVLFAFLSPQFLTSMNLRNLLVVQVTVCCMAFAAILPLIIGEFDLSLGYLIGFLMMVGALLGGMGFGAGLVIPVMLVGGAAVGSLSGWLRVRFQISSFIATLGVGIALSGVTQALSGGNVLFSGIPPLITSIGQNEFLGIGISIWLTLILAGVLVYVLEHTPLGRQFYAIGGSERVAFLAGIRLNLYRVLAFACAGLLVGVAAIFELGQAGGANPLFGPELLLPAYAAAFLGVTTYRPGYFNVPGAVIAIILLAVGFNGMNLLGAPYWLQPIFNGAVLVVAVITAKAESRQIMK